MSTLKRPFWIVDVFTDRRFAGNPAAVVADATGLSDSQMQLIAAEFNLSETTFICPESSIEAQGDPKERVRPLEARGSPPADLVTRFRWFTPKLEAGMCGHATIAGVHVLVEAGRLPCPEGVVPVVRINTRSGDLTAFVEPIPNRPGDRMIWVELCPPVLRAQAIDIERLAHVLRIPRSSVRLDLPIMRTQDDDLLVLVESVGILNDAQPDFPALGEFLDRVGLRGLSLATVGTLSPSISVQSRFFAPPVGVNEDPVTGSVHGPLAAYLVEKQLVPVHDGIAGMMCVQGTPGGRSGVIYALVESQGRSSLKVRVGGQSVIAMHGELFS